MENELQYLQDKNESLEKEVVDLLEKLRLSDERNKRLENENKKLKDEVSELKTYKEETSSSINRATESVLESYRQTKRSIFKMWIRQEGLIDDYNKALEEEKKNWTTEEETIDELIRKQEIWEAQEVPPKK